MNTEVVRSARRRNTVQARMVGDVLRVAIPAAMSRSEELHWVALMKSKFELRATSEPVELTNRARRLARLYGLPVPDSIRWVHNQQTRWGSCTPEDRTIRISSRVAVFPGWVLDYLIVHELAHLREPGHGKAFQELVERYPRAERATGFLIAMGREWNENGHLDVEAGNP
ncbi:MAG: M48 metallopeptidase family protein [Acidimicrobiia bacterium]